MGLQFRRQCFCGNASGRHGILNQSNGYRPCSGNFNQTCGKNNANSGFIISVIMIIFCNKFRNLSQVVTTSILRYTCNILALSIHKIHVISIRKLSKPPLYALKGIQFFFSQKGLR